MKKVNFRKMRYQIWEKKIPIFVTIFLFFLLSIAYTLNYSTPFYQSTVNIELTAEQGKELDEKRITTYASMIQSGTILEQVIQNLELNIEEETLQENISVKPVGESAFLQVTVKQDNPQDAIRIANELAETFIQKAKETYHIHNLERIEEASIPERAYYMLPIQDIFLFCVVGAILSIGYVGIENMIDQQKEAKQMQKIKEKKERDTKEKQEKMEKIQSNEEKGEKNETKSKRGRKKNS